MSLTTGPANTTGNLVFLVKPPAGVRAYTHINADPVTGERKGNYSSIKETVTIENLRGKESQYTLDNAGFQLGTHPARHEAFTNDADVEREYYPESIELLKKVTGASRVVLFDHSQYIYSSSSGPRSLPLT